MHLALDADSGPPHPQAESLASDDDRDPPAGFLRLALRTTDLSNPEGFAVEVLDLGGGWANWEAGTVMFQVVSRGGLLTGEEVRVMGPDGDYGGASISKRPVVMWHKTGKSVMKLIEQGRGTTPSIFSLECVDGSDENLLLNVDSSNRTLRWYVASGNKRMGQLAFESEKDGKNGLWILDIVSGEKLTFSSQ